MSIASTPGDGQPNPAKSLLARHLRSEQAAVEERRAIRRRQRDRELYYRAAAPRSEQTSETLPVTSRPPAQADAGQIARLTAKLAQLARNLPALIDERARSIIAAELPDAIQYLAARRECANGQPTEVDH